MPLTEFLIGSFLAQCLFAIALIVELHEQQKRAAANGERAEHWKEAFDDLSAVRLTPGRVIRFPYIQLINEVAPAFERENTPNEDE